MNIYEAITAHDADHVKQLLSNDAALLNSRAFDIPDGATWLHLAASEGALEVCDVLLSYGIDINIAPADTGYLTPLVDAVSSGNLALVKWFCERGALVDGQPRGITTPLIEAALMGHKDIIQYLLTQSPEINRLQTNFNQTALDTARLYRHANVAELLADSGGLSAQEIIYPEKERAAGVLACFYDNVGMILSSKLSWVEGTQQIDIRTAILDNKDKFKVVFTIGGYERTPRKEFFLCLPFRWPLTASLIATDDPWAFPQMALQKITDYWLRGNNVTEGFVMDKTSPEWSMLHWPSEIDALVAVDYPFGSGIKDENIDDDLVTLLLLAPLKYTKSGRPNEKKLTELVDKYRQLKWHRLAFKDDWR